MQFLPRLPFEIGSLRFKILLNDRKGWRGSLVKKFRYVCGAYSTKVENTNKNVVIFSPIDLLIGLPKPLEGNS